MKDFVAFKPVLRVAEVFFLWSLLLLLCRSGFVCAVLATAAQPFHIFASPF